LRAVPSAGGKAGEMSKVPAVYAVRMNPLAASEEHERLARWSSRVPAERATRIARFRHWEDRWRSLAGDMLVRYALQREYGLADDRWTIERGPHGKPQLAGARACHVQYNVSHSGLWAVAAFHSEAIGIDIEQFGKADMQLAKTMFADSEYDALLNLEESGRDRLFFAIWTGKESYTKARGLGLSLPLDSFRVAGAEYDGKLLPVVEAAGASQSQPNWHLRTFELDPDYMLCVCSTSSVWPASVRVVAAAELG